MTRLFPDINSWALLNDLMENLDCTDDESWNNFIDAFIESLSSLLEVNNYLIMDLMGRKYSHMENPFPVFFNTYSKISSAAISSIRETLSSLECQYPSPVGISVAMPSREVFYSEYQASHISLELQMIQDEIIFNDEVDDQKKFDITKETTDSVKSFIKRMFRFVPKIESILATVNEMLSIGRKLSS